MITCDPQHSLTHGLLSLILWKCAAQGCDAAITVTKTKNSSHVHWCPMDFKAGINYSLPSVVPRSLAKAQCALYFEPL